MKTKASFYLQITYVKRMLKVLDSVLRKNCEACQGLDNVHQVCAVRYWDHHQEKNRIIDLIFEDLWAEIDIPEAVAEWKTYFNIPIKVYPGWYEEIRDLLVYMM